jgi:hypothetical protein
MRYLSILCIVFGPAFVFAGEKLTPRPLDPLAAATLTHAIERSAIAGALVAQLESSNVIVHIVTSAQMPDGIGGTTRFVTSRGGYRYLRITLGAGLPLRQRSAILAHELQHAWEVARSPATDIGAIKRLFEDEGHRAGEYYETRAAIAVERTVLIELLAGRRPSTSFRAGLQAEPIVKFDQR